MTTLRLWPGVLGAGLLVVCWFVLPLLVPTAGILAFGGAFLSGVGIALWWLLFSRAPWRERLAVPVVMVVAAFAVSFVIHPSIQGGMMGLMFPLYVFPALMLGLVVWAVAARGLAQGPRRVALVAAMLVASGLWTTVRTDGVTGEGTAQLRWRWTPTTEQQLLVAADDAPPPVVPEPQVEPAAPVPESAADVVDEAVATPAPMPEAPVADVAPLWPGFRGAGRNSVVAGARIATDWIVSPPVEVWRRPVGPGWSSFAVGRTLFYTQEQRGDDEVVSAYDLATGEPVWRHADPVRFWESNGGAGPRATPTLSDGRVYSFGATGLLNVLDAATGAKVWSRDVAADTEARVPDWGFSASPLVVGDLVVAFARRLAAYDRATGEPRWMGPAFGGGYSSPQLMTLDGVEQIVMVSGQGATGVSPDDGAVLWQHAWAGAPIVQPALTEDGDLLLTTAGMTGGLATRRLHVSRTGDGPDAGAWTVEERWTSRGLKPYFNDFVVHEGHAYGFDGSILSCIDLATGDRRWKGGRYGHGQFVLLPADDLLLVISEEGELALVRASPDGFSEVARVPALEGKTWNHPVLVGDLLLVRNGAEMAAFRLASADRAR